MSRLHPLAPVVVAILVLSSCGGGGDGGGTGPDSDFHPTSNTNLSGSITYKSVNIPAGVTVTGTSDLNLTVTGDVVIAGTLTVPCHTVTITSNGLVTVSGTVTNVCGAPAQSGNQLAIIGKGGYDFEGAHVLASGNIVIVDGPNLSPVASVVPADLRIDRQASVGAPYRCKLVNTTIDAGDPKPKAQGSDGVTDGADGNTIIDGCGQLFTGQTGGNLLISNLTVNGSDGLDGSNGTGTESARGGAGGNAGPISFVSDEDIDITGADEFNGGGGGDGGSANATNNAAGGNATAIGGHGGGLQPPGGAPTIQIVSNQGSITVTGQMSVKLGTAGFGGNATAIAGKGADGNPGGKGGDATATGGDGGDGAPAVQNAHGAVTINGSITVTGGDAGNGGFAKTRRGNGGAGSVPGAAGGNGGNGGYHGGKGGKGVIHGVLAGASAAENAFVLEQNSKAGDGGAADDGGGDGGAGGPCFLDVQGPPGGNGGTSAGGPGSGGHGATDGHPGGTTIQDGTSLGGNGGGGRPGGPGGLHGAFTFVPPIGTTGQPSTPGSFLDGNQGPTCPSVSLSQPSPQTQSVAQGGTGTVQSSLVRTNFPGALDWQVKNPTGTVIASGTVAAGATSFSAQFPIAAGTAIGPGTYSLSVSAAGGPSASAPFTVNVIAAGAGVQIVWINCNTDTPIVYASWYDGASGAAPWNQLPINTSVPGQQSVSFTATQPAVQFVVVTRKPDGSAVTTTFLNLLATQLKPESDASCSGSTTGTTTVQGAITLNAGQATFIGTAGGSTSFVGPAVTYSIPNVLTGSHTFIGARQPSNSLFDFAQVFRNVTVPGPGPTFDFTTNAIQLMSGTVAATNTTNSWRSQTNMVTPDGASGIVSRTAFNTAATKNQFWMPGTALQNGEYNQTIDFTSGSADFEQITGYWFGDVPAGRTIPFPNPIDFNYTQVSANGVNPVLFSATGTVPSNLNQLIAMSLTQTAGGIARTINLYESDAFNNNLSSFNITMAPYAATWIPPEYGLQTGTLVNFALEHFGSSVANGVFMPPTSNRTITVAAKFKTTTPN